MEKIMLKDISIGGRTPLISLKDGVSVGDAKINADGSIKVGSRGGIKTAAFKNGSICVDIYVKCKSENPLTLRVGYIKRNGEETFEGVHAVTVAPKEDGIVVLEKDFDPSGLSIYYDAESIYVQIDCEEENTFTIMEELIWQRGTLEKLSFYADNLEKMMLKMEECLDRITRMSNSNIENIAVAPDGNKYVINVDNEGKLSATSVIPDKVLFVGNSLLLGLGHYGMCSTSPRSDYYYHMTEAIKAKNPNASFSRVSGSRYESLDNPEDFDKLWYSIENSHTHRPLCESFTSDLDLIILQLGTNVNCKERAAAFAQTIDPFISRIRQSSPHARIIWVHGWDYEHISGPIIADACQRWRIGHVCIKDLCVKENQASLMQTYERTDGKTDMVDEYWIGHPGDVGMKRIAERILAFLNI